MLKINKCKQQEKINILFFPIFYWIINSFKRMQNINAVKKEIKLL